jgi:hypothetical protein
MMMPRKLNLADLSEKKDKMKGKQLTVSDYPIQGQLYLAVG